jgi:hypothetical protein
MPIWYLAGEGGRGGGGGSGVVTGVGGVLHSVPSVAGLSAALSLVVVEQEDFN